MSNVQLNNMDLHQFVPYQRNDWISTLYYAAACNNEEITRRLIRAGVNINIFNSELKTPLMIAVERRSVEVVEVLLKANANIDVVDFEGRSALQLLFESLIFDKRILSAFVKKFKCSSFIDEAFFIRLINARCSMYHAAVLRDFQIMKGLLERGISIDSTNNNGRTALHAAVHRDDWYLVEWLLKNKANVNALDRFNQSPLYEAAYNGNVKLIRMLLENNANPNIVFGPSPLYQVFKRLTQLHLGISESEWDDCVELLLQHGAIPQDPIDPLKIGHFELALMTQSFKRLSYMICHLAVLDRLGISIGKSMMWCRIRWYQHYYVDIRMYYRQCQEKLKVKCGTLSLFELLTANDDEMRVYARNKTLVREVENICEKMSGTFVYYAKTLRKRITKAVYTVKFEEASILTISKLFNGNYNQCYNFASKVVRYLSKHDLEQLTQVGVSDIPEFTYFFKWYKGNSWLLYNRLSLLSHEL